MKILKRVVKGKTYFAVYEKGKFVQHIGNADDLKVFQRNVDIGKTAAAILSARPYLNPKACLGILAADKKLSVGKVSLPDKQYKAIIIDPPWDVEKILRDERPQQADFDYPVMTVEEIKALPIALLAEPTGCHVYLWTTQKYLPAAFQVFESWGVSYQCLMTWVKNVGFTPFSWMYSTEHCLFGHIGSLPLLKMGLRLDFQAKVREHSRKPEIFYDLVSQASPEPRLDMFSREKREKYDQWGNEASKYGADTIPD